MNRPETHRRRARAIARTDAPRTPTIGWIALGAALAAAVALAAGSARAQTAALEDPLAGFTGTLAPGYETPERETEPTLREPLRPFGVTPEANVIEIDKPIDDFAGHPTNYDQGIVAGALGRLKDGILGR